MGRLPRSSRQKDKNMSVSCGRQALRGTPGALSFPVDPLSLLTLPDESEASEPHSFLGFPQASPSTHLGFSHPHPDHSGLPHCWAGGFLRPGNLTTTKSTALPSTGPGTARRALPECVLSFYLCEAIVCGHQGILAKGTSGEASAEGLWGWPCRTSPSLHGLTIKAPRLREPGEGSRAGLVHTSITYRWIPRGR